MKDSFSFAEKTVGQELVFFKENLDGDSLLLTST